MTARGQRLLGGSAFLALATGSALVFAVPAQANPSNGIPTEFRPSLPLFGPGPAVNFLGGDHQAVTNASAHVAWSLAVPLVSQQLGGRKGLWIGGLSWIAATMLQESLFHAPPRPGPGYASEVRSDLLTRIVPTALLLVLDATRGGSHLSSDAPGRMREVPRVQAERPAPTTEARVAPSICPDVGDLATMTASDSAPAVDARWY